MAEVKIYVSEELDKRFRKAAMDAFGYGKGSISRAAQEALLEWCRKRETIDQAPKTPQARTRELKDKPGPAFGVEKDMVQPAEVDADISSRKDLPSQGQA